MPLKFEPPNDPNPLTFDPPLTLPLPTILLIVHLVEPIIPPLEPKPILELLKVIPIGLLFA